MLPNLILLKNTFQFLVEMDPSSLVHTDENGDVPLHFAARYSTIQAFRTVFEYLIRYYPTKKGISSLFTKNNRSRTVFQIACEKYGKDGVMRIVENTLNNSVIPLNIIEAVVMTAMDGNVHLDCVYFLLRREPHVLVQLLSASHNNNNNDDDGGGGNYNHGNDVFDDGDGDDDNDDDNDDDDNDDDDIADGDGDSDSDNDNGNDSDGGIVDSKNNKACGRKRKRSL